MSDNSPEDVGGPAEAGGWTGGTTRPGVSVPTKCASCDAAIRWIRMGDSGKGMPVDAKSELRVIERRPTRQQGDLFGADAVSPGGGPGGTEAPRLAGHLVQVWRPHWETCTEPDRWRK